MNLYHIHLGGLDTLPKVLEPKIPRAILDGENDYIKRISLSTSVIGCLLGIGYSRLETYLDDTYGTVGKSLITIISVNTKDLNDTKLFTTQYLDDNELVEDAYFTGEFWYTDAIPISETIIKTVIIKDIIYDDFTEYIIPKQIRDNIILKSNGNQTLCELLEGEYIEQCLDNNEDILAVQPIKAFTFTYPNSETVLKHTKSYPILECSIPTTFGNW